MNGQDLKKSLFDPKVDKYQLLANLKLINNVKEFNKKIKPISNYPLVKKIFHSTPLPKNLSDIRRNKIAPFTNEITGEILWYLYTVKDYSKEINSFLKLKVQFENNLILGLFSEAENCLNNIDDSICKSIWGIENRLLLKELQSGSEGNWSLLSDILKEVQDPFVLFFSEQLSKRAESKISYVQYKNLFNQILSSLDASLFEEYISFRLNYPNFSNFRNFAYFLSVESISSVIDRYLLLVDVIVEMLSYEDVFESQIFLNEILQELTKYIHEDSRIKQIYNYLSGLKYYEFDNSFELITVLDEYTKGNFSFVIENVPNLITKFPQSLELYEVFIKSLIEQRKTLDTSNLSELIKQVLENLYEVFTRGENNDSATEKLLKISLSLFSSNFGKQLFSILSSLSNINPSAVRTHKLFFVIYSTFNNPRTITYISPIKESFANNISYFEGKFPNSITILVNKSIATFDLSILEKNELISKVKKPVYLTRAYILKDDFVNAKKYIENVIENMSLSVIGVEELLIHLYSCYLNLNEIKKAINLYIYYFIENQAYTIRLDRFMLLEKLKSSIESNLVAEIDLPIFLSIVVPDVYERYVAYDDFMNFHGIEKPSQLFETKNFDQKKLLLFFKNVCTVEVMHHSLSFTGTEDIEDERLSILKELLKIDKTNETIYIKEIAEITQKSKIRKAIIEVNKGKISINVQQLRNSEVNNIREGFRRYQELISFTRANELTAIDSSSKMINTYLNSLNDEKITNKVIYSHDPAFINFKTMLIDMREKFLWSKEYGLDGYLSTRIRHGTLVNHIRSVFESFNLISQKGETDAYLDNEYWSDKISYYLKAKEPAIQNALKTFSKKIDDFTSYIIRELIQIKTERSPKKDNALFDYSFSNEVYGKMFLLTRDVIKDYKAFTDFIFEYLEEQTNLILEKIRYIFVNEISNSYTSIIDELQMEIKNILGDSYSIIDLTSSIFKSNTQIQNELKNISEWFNLSTPSADLLLDLTTIIQTSIEITNSIYPNNKLNPQLAVDSDLSLSGSIHLIYIIRILLDNIINHSGLSSTELDVKITAKFLNNKSLEIIITNNLSNKIDAIELSTRLNSQKILWNNRKDFERTNIEGGSGFDKIRRILAFDLGSQNFDLNFEIIDNRFQVTLQLEVKFFEYEK